MKSPLVFLSILCLSFLFYVACGNSEREVANGYTEEQNATNLDSIAFAKLMRTWQPEIPVDSTRKDNKELGLWWYDIQFTSTEKVYYKYPEKTADEYCVVSLYEKQNGVRLNLTRVYKKNVYTEFLDRDSMLAMVEDRLDNSYDGEDSQKNCLTDSSAFVSFCLENDGVLKDRYRLKVCSELHLTCSMKFKPKVNADEYLQSTAKRLKEQCIVDFYSPNSEDDPENTEKPSEENSGEVTENEIEDETGNLPEEGADDPEIDTLLTDSRDGHVYKVVKVGTQVWMAENLNYDAGDGSACYEDLETNCDVYGRLYAWAIANQANQVDDESNHQGVCPDGWRMPALDDFDILMETVSNDVGGLKSTMEWDEPIGNGTNAYGFDVLPAGTGEYSADGSSFKELGVTAKFWTSSSMGMGLAADILRPGNLNVSTKLAFFPVRCLKK